MLFFICKSYCNDNDNVSDSGISGSWRSTNSVEDTSESSPLLYTATDSGYRMYTEEKVQYYGNSRKQENEVNVINIQYGNM